MDYLLAAHIQVTGGAEAAMQINQVVTQINNFGAAAKTANTGGMATDLDKAAQSSGGLSAALGRVGDAMVRMATYQGIRIVEQGIRSAVNSVLDFDEAMTNSLAIQQGVTGRMRGDMESLAESLAVKFGEAPAEVAKGFYYLASAGLDVSQQLAALPTVTAFAKAGMMDLDSATEMLLDSLSAIGQKSSDPQELAHNLGNLADVLTEAAIASQATVEQMGQALSNKAGASIKAFNLDLNESVGVLEVFADQGIKGTTAGERFSMLIRDMALKSQKFGEQWAAMGVQVFDSNGQFNSLVTIFTQLDAALLPLSGQDRIAALKAMGFTLRDISTVMSVLGTSTNLAAFVADLGRAGGVAQRVAETQMESLRAKLAQLAAVTAVFAIEGFDRLEQAAAWLVSTFTPAVNAVVDAMGDLARGALPVARAFGGLVAIGVVEGIKGIASAIEVVFSAIAGHPGAVEALGFALAALAAGSVIGNILAIGVALGETLAAKARLAKDAIVELAASMRAMDAATALGGLRDGWTALMNALNSPIVAGTGVGLFIYGLVNQFDQGRKAADNFAKAIEQRLDMKSLTGLDEAVREMQAHYDVLRAKNNDFANDSNLSKLGTIIGTELDAATPGFFHFSDNLLKLQGNLRNSKADLEEWRKAQENIRSGFEAINNSTQFADKNAFVMDDMTNRLVAMGVAAKKAGVDVDTSIPTLERLAKAAKLDLSSDWHEWAPTLEAAAIKSAMLGDSTGKLDGAVTALSSDLTPFEDQLKAYSEVVKSMAGGMDDQFSATTKVSGAFAELGSAMGAAPATFDVLTEAGRKQRDALSGVVDVVWDMAATHAAATGDLGQGANALLSYSTGLTRVFEKAGLTKGSIEELLTQFGLTPAQIKTVFEVVADPALGSVHQIDEGMANVASSAAIAAFELANFQAALEALVAPSSQMASLAQAANGMIALSEATAKYVAGGGDLTNVFNDHSKAANDLVIAFSGTVQGHAKVAQEMANNKDIAGGKQYLIDYRTELYNMLAGFNLTREQILPLLEALGLTDEKINALDGAKANVEVTDNGTAAATTTALDAIPDAERVAEIYAQPTNIDPANVDLAAVADAERIAEIYAVPKDVEPTDAAFNNTARKRESEAHQYGTNWPTVDSVFNQSARDRNSNANQTHTGEGGTEGAFSGSARDRNSNAHQSASGWSGVDALFNYAARDRISTVTLNYTTTGTVYAGPNGTGIAEGDVIHAYASGGFENHTAQIGRAGRTGVTRMWNEPETGGEAYIPLAMAKRDRSLAIWEETGKLLGARSSTHNVSVSAPISVNISGAGDPDATGRAVAAQVESGINHAFRRLLVEMKS